MTTALRAENAVFVTQDSLLLVGWCVNDLDEAPFLRINGKIYARIPPTERRADVAENVGGRPDALTGIRRIVLLRPDDADADRLEIELVLLQGGEETLSNKLVVGTAAKNIHRVVRDLDDNTERLESRYRWPDNLEAGLTSVILGVYNGERYLPAAIDSILAQTDRNIQVILVDDGSTDGTRDILLDYKDQDARIELILKDRNGGQGHAINAGILRARGDLTCLMDADDLWYPQKVEVVREVYEEHRAAGLYTIFQHKLNICYGDEVSQHEFRDALLDGDIINFSRKEKIWIPGPFIPTSGLSFPTEILRVAFPVPRTFRICADGFLTRAAISFGHSKAIPANLGAYRIHGGNSTVGNEAFDQQKYIADVLVPEVNGFFERKNIDLRLPIETRSYESVPLNRLVPVRTGKGIYYTGEPRREARGIEDFRDIHKGKRAFIVATGPSLDIADLEALKDEITFACNKITLAFDETDWRPTYYAIIDSLVSETFEVDWSDLPSVKFFPEDLKSRYRDVPNAFFVKNRTPIYDGETRVFEFSKDLSQGAAGGFTVIYFLLQLAYHMGIEEVYLIGLDFSFSYKALSGEKTTKGEDVIVNGDEVNHFHKDYRPAGEKWTKPRLDLQEAAFIKAREAFQGAGRAVINASRKTRLEVFDRVGFPQLLHARQQQLETLRFVGDIYGGVISADYNSVIEELRVRGWITPKPERVDILHDGREVCSASIELEGHQNPSLVSGEGIYIWNATGSAPIRSGDQLRVLLTFADGSSSILTSRVETRSEEDDLKLAVRELHSRNRQLQQRLEAGTETGRRFTLDR
ncbi:glycosyltransferase [Microbaculum marinum]|uniref:Glycosyltransferase n=1 Tax=Microbaculum marinum TaxID=1764581 RepID=A0AAW9RWV9_9HYPH